MSILVLVCSLLCIMNASAFMQPQRIVTPSPSNSYYQSTKMMADDDDDDDSSEIGRRTFLSTSSLVTAALTSQVTSAVAASDDGFSTFIDDDLNFQVSFPSNWVKSVQSLSDRRKIILFTDPNQQQQPTGKDQNLMFIAYTPVRDDFTSLSSFGSVDEVARKTILPKGELAGMESENNLINAESKKNSYYFDYTTKIPDQPKRHFRTIFTLIPGGTGGAGSVLVTLTAQSTETNYSDMKASYDEIIQSFGKK